MKYKMLFAFACSGDTDGRLPVTSTNYSMKKIKARVKTPWYPWYYQDQVILLHMIIYIYSTTHVNSLIIVSLEVMHVILFVLIITLKVGGYVIEYENLTFVSIRGAGHFVASYQPGRALEFFSSFVSGKLPPRRG